MGRWPTDFPGLVIDPYRQCVVNQVELARFPVRVCECFNDCTNPGAPFPMLTECFIYGITQGDLEKGCPVITDGALGVTVGFLEAHFFVKLDFGVDTNLLQGGGTTANTALRFNTYIGKPVGLYEVYLVDGMGRRAYISFAPPVAAILWVSIPLDDFVIVDPGFDFTAVRSVFFGFTNNFQVAECMMAIDNVRVCTNGAGIGGLSFNPDSEPYGGNLPGDSCVMLEDFNTEQSLQKVTCDAPEPRSPTPEVCDQCVVGPPLIDGNGAIHFCVDDIPEVFYPPSIRYAGPTFSLTTDITFTVYSWRPGVNVRVILVDYEGRRAIYNFVAIGGSQTVTVTLLAFSYPDGAFDPLNVSAWWTIFGTSGVNSDDRFAVDELMTNGGTVLINDMSTLGDIYCGYDPEPQEPFTTMECEWVALPPALPHVTPPQTVNFDALTWTGPLTIATASQPCDDIPPGGPGYWDLGFDDPMNPIGGYDVQIGFNLPALPPSLSLREIILTLFDEAGRELMIQVYPPTLVIGNNVITVGLPSNEAGQPTLESKGRFNARRVMYWQIGFIGVEVDTIVYPFVINFEGFQFRANGNVTKAFLFENYGPGNPGAGKVAFEALGGYSCYEDWRQVKVAPVGTTFEFLAGAGVTVDTDPTFDERYIGIDRGKIPVHDDRTELRTEVWMPGNGFNPGFASGHGWDKLDTRFRARPDSAAPCDMWFAIQTVRGQTATWKFDSHAGGPPVLPPDQWRQFNTSKPNLNFPLGDVLSDFWRLFRVLKVKTQNQPRSGVVPTGRDQFTGDELDFLKVRTDGPTIGGEEFVGKCGSTTVDAVRDTGKWSSIAAYADDQPGRFDGHVHHETDCGVAGGNLTGDPPPEWPINVPSPYHVAFNGWLKINKFIEGQGVMRVEFPAPVNLSAQVTNPNSFFQIFAYGTNFGGGLQLATIAEVQLILHDSIGGTATIDLGVNLGSGGSGLLGAPEGWNPANLWLTGDFIANNNLYAMLFRLIENTDGGIDWTAVTGYELKSNKAGDGWRLSKTWFFQDAYGPFYTPTLLYNWNRASWPNLAGFQNPSNQFSVGKAMDPATTPVVALNCDRTKKIAYWGMHEDWVRAADIVLVPAKYRDDPIVGINGNRGYDEFGAPLPGVLEALARDTQAWYGNIAFRVPPFAGCRNIWMDLCYIEEVACLGEDLEKAVYDFWDTACPCYGPPQEISTLSTDKWLDRILPDDQFVIEPGAQALPSGYPEAAYFEYCAIPDCDAEAVDDTDPDFTFIRRTPTCSRPDDPLNTMYGYYRVEVEVIAKTNPVTVNWADVLNPGETLMSGVMAGSILFSTVGERHQWEYIVKTGQLQGGSITITGAAWAAMPPVTLVSPSILMDVDCDTVSWHRFGTQSPNVYGQVFWAGGGRPDPVVPPGINFWTKVWAGPGSAGLSRREQYLFADATVPGSWASWTFQLGGTGIEGFAVGLPVWIFNTDFVDNPARAITGLDIEAEESQVDPNEEVTGLYGVVASINPGLMQVTVNFSLPLPNQQVRFTMLAKACMMVAPYQSRGYYWEASPDLVDLAKSLPHMGEGRAEVRWGFRYWNSTRYPAKDTQGAGYVCDGDGGSFLYEIHGESVREIINPVDWMDLLCSPVQETKLANDALPTQDDIRVCDICLFEPCSIVQIVDENCTGKEGGGPGHIASVVSTTPDDPGKTCATLYAAEGHLKIIPQILVAYTGCGVVDGFKTTRRARAFVKPDVARYAYSPTTKVDVNGVPVEGQNFVGVDFATGTFTFIPDVVVSNPCVCFKALNASIQLDTGLPGIYFLKGIDKSGCKSPPSKPIKIVGESSEPEDCGVGLSPTLLFHKTLNDGEIQYEGPQGVDLPIVGSTFNFTLAVPSRVEFRVSFFGFDVVWGSRLGKDMTGWTELWAKDLQSPAAYKIMDRLLMARSQGSGGECNTEADGGAGSVGSRVIDLQAGNYQFDLTIRNGAPPSAGRTRSPIDIQVWRYGVCIPPQ